MKTSVSLLLLGLAIAALGITRTQTAGPLVDCLQKAIPAPGDLSQEPHNTFTWHPETRSWSSLMRQKDSHGQWVILAEDNLRRG